jgi:hypothetical protein
MEAAATAVATATLRKQRLGRTRQRQTAQDYEEELKSAGGDSHGDTSNQIQPLFYIFGLFP